MEAMLACHPALSTEWLAVWQNRVNYDVWAHSVAWRCITDENAHGSSRTCCNKNVAGDAIFKMCGTFKYTLNSEPKALTGDKSEGTESEAKPRLLSEDLSPGKAEGEELMYLYCLTQENYPGLSKKTILKDKLP